MTLVLDGPAIFDAALAAASTISVLRGTSPPYKPEKIKPSVESSGKAGAKSPGKDLVTQLHVSTSALVVHPIVVLQGAVAIWRILYPAPAADREDWLSVRYIWRLANLTAIAGGLGRRWCYRTLGKHFTFDLRINPDHKVVQSGPYALVRHPSYTAIFLLAVGGTIAQTLLNPGFPLATRKGLPLRATVAALIGGTSLLIYRRIVEEEEMLKKDPSIGTQYQAYMRKVRSRLIPGLF